MFKLDLEKAERPEIKLPTTTGSLKKQESSRNISTSASLTMPKSLTMWMTKNWKILQEMEHQTTLPASWEICMQVKKQQLELDMEQMEQTRNGWLQIGKGVCQGCILSPCLFNLYAEYIMQNARLDEEQAEIKTSGWNINNLRYADHTILWQKARKNERASWWTWKRGVKKLA